MWGGLGYGASSVSGKLGVYAGYSHSYDWARPFDNYVEWQSLGDTR